jgi:peroxiredoxin
MKRYNGEEAPDFLINDIRNNPIRLSDYKGKKILLGFYRNETCPFCNMRVHQISKMWSELQQKNVQPLFIFESRPQTLLRSIFHESIASMIPVIGDPEKKLYELYGVERSSVIKIASTFLHLSSFTTLRQAKEQISIPAHNDRDRTINVDRVPADFLIDEQFRIVKAHYGSHMNDHIPLDEIKAFAGYYTKTPAYS